MLIKTSAEGLFSFCVLCTVFIRICDAYENKYLKVTRQNACSDTKSKCLTLYEKSLRDCAVDCDIRKQCQAVNYKKKHKVCELLSDGTFSKSPEQTGPCVFVQRSDIYTTILPDVCQRKCVDGQVCDWDNGECMVKECQPFSIENGYISGNMLKVGSKLKITCHNGYAPVNGERYSTCLSTGQWEPAIVCEEMDECADNTDNCHADATCTNTVGSFTCACNSGFAGDGVTTCTETDECADNSDNCHADATCTNIVGSFMCACKSGFTGDGVTACTEKDECADNTDNCHADATCTNTVGSFTCACNSGFTGDGVTTCTETDECADNSDNCHADATCTNLVGSFTCACKNGFTGDGVTACTEKDECADNTDNCHADATCTNTVGSFTCACNSGFSGDGVTTCTETDECADNSDNCHADATCTNVVGSFMCACKSGFTGDGVTTCTEKDECADNTDNCHADATCTNTVGSFTCACNSGFSGDGVTTCTETNECADSSDNCHADATCTNTVGSYTCACKNGFTGDGVTACTEKDECADNTDNCHADATCTNTVGSFTCACNSGFTGDGITTCTETITDCSDVLDKGFGTTSGVYTITSATYGAMSVYCDMVTDGGGWTVFQNRYDGSVDFYRSFSDYENGFGNVNGEFWMGLKYIHEMTKDTTNQVYLKFVDPSGNTAFERIETFKIGSGSSYALTAGPTLVSTDSSTGTSNSFMLSNGAQFSTQDQGDTSCADECHGGWWHDSGCETYINPNGHYTSTCTNSFWWCIYNYKWKGLASMKATRLMFRKIGT